MEQQKSVKKFRGVYSLRPIRMPETYWTIFATGKCPFCDGKKFLRWNPKGSPFSLIPCKNCMRVFVFPKINNKQKKSR